MECTRLGTDMYDFFFRNFILLTFFISNNININKHFLFFIFIFCRLIPKTLEVLELSKQPIS